MNSEPPNRPKTCYNPSKHTTKKENPNHGNRRIRRFQVRARPGVAPHAQVLGVRRGVRWGGQLEGRGLHFQPGRASPHNLDARRRVHQLVGGGNLLRQPARHLHRAQRQRLARRPRLPHRHRVHAGREAASDARREARALPVVPGDALQHALRIGDSAGRLPVRLGRLRRASRPQVQRGRRADKVLGQARNRPRRVRAAPQHLGGQKQPRLYRRPREQPHAAVHRRGRVH